jgi:hypothetical protein
VGRGRVWKTVQGRGDEMRKIRVREVRTKGRERGRKRRLLLGTMFV